MQLVFDSLTGNTRAFTQRLAAAAGLEATPVGEYAGGDYLLLTYTFGKGEVPKTTNTFLSRHSASMRGVASSGSFHWGANFGRAARTIAEQYGVPLVAVFNKRGSEADIERIKQWIHGSS